MYITNHWYIGCMMEELGQKNPIGRKILGRDIVIFQTRLGKIYAIENRCCHRNVALSLGYVTGEHLKCAYHGWEFDGTGRCVYIPSLGSDQQIPPAACVAHYPVTIAHCAVWIFIGDVEQAEKTPIPPMSELTRLPFVFNYHELKADLKLVAESLIDPYHIDHVHRHSIRTFMGTLYRPSVEFKTELNGSTLIGSYLRENNGHFLEKFYFGFDKYIQTFFSFYFPHTSKLHIAFPKKNMFIYEHFYPIENDRIMMLQITCWENIFRRLPLWLAKKWMLQKSNRIVEEDIAFLESHKYYHETHDGVHDMLTKADKVSIEFAKLWRACLEKQFSPFKAEA